MFSEEFPLLVVNLSSENKAIGPKLIYIMKVPGPSNGLFAWITTKNKSR